MIFSDWAGSFTPEGCVLGSPIRQRGGTRAVPAVLQERRQQFDRQREDDGGILIGGYFRECLEVAHLHRHGIGRHDLGGLPEFVGGLELPLGVDDLRAPVAFGLRLGGHGPLHRVGEVHILDFHDGDFNPPRLGVPIDDLLQAVVHFVPLRQEVIEFRLTQRAAQGRQGHLGRGEQEILHLQNGLAWDRRPGNRARH